MTKKNSHLRSFPNLLFIPAETAMAVALLVLSHVASKRRIVALIILDCSHNTHVLFYRSVLGLIIWSEPTGRSLTSNNALLNTNRSSYTHQICLPKSRKGSWAQNGHPRNELLHWAVGPNKWPIRVLRSLTRPWQTRISLEILLYTRIGVLYQPALWSEANMADSQIELWRLTKISQSTIYLPPKQTRLTTHTDCCRASLSIVDWPRMGLLLGRLRHEVQTSRRHPPRHGKPL
jgi:hypothetical protein